MTERHWLQTCRHWVFDLDGTLTRPVHDFQHIRRELGIPADADILDTLARLPEPLRGERLARLDALERHYAEQAEAAAGALTLLALLASRGCSTGILTRNSRELALLSLDAIGALEYFVPEHVLGRDEAQPKPDPDGLRRLLHNWRAPPHRALMVGDFRYDLEAGRSAGMRTVHVDARLERSWPELTDLRVHGLTDLVQLLR